MTKSVLVAAVCAILSSACEITCIDDCDDHGADENDAPRGSLAGGKTSSSAGSGGKSASGGASCGDESGDGSGVANAPGSGGHAQSESTPCSKESDCERGFNCDYERHECAPADAETCAELSSETACDDRNDCVSVYAGTHCSCGAECTCVGGEPGCVCESFAFFRCEPLDP